MKYQLSISRNLKIIIGVLGGFLLALILIPVLFVMSAGAITENGELIKDTLQKVEIVPEIPFQITVYRTESGLFETMDFERYIIGVVAAEMPALFEMDALRAQAIAARTYAMRILQHDDYILDTVMHQVFLDDTQLKARWEDDFDRHFATIEEAVVSTEGLLIVYEGQLITPMFFAMSSGATENSEDVFVGSRPYLRSVPSLGYESHPSFAQSVGFTLSDLRDAFYDETISESNVKIISHSVGGNVLTMMMGAKEVTGRDVREVLGLRSAAFSIEIVEGEGVIFTTYGHGHGVGMSQHGANVMAQNGHSYLEILNHFYQSIELIEKNYFLSE